MMKEKSDAGDVFLMTRVQPEARDRERVIHHPGHPSFSATLTKREPAGPLSQHGQLTIEASGGLTFVGKHAVLSNIRPLALSSQRPLTHLVDDHELASACNRVLALFPTSNEP